MIDCKPDFVLKKRPVRGNSEMVLPVYDFFKVVNSWLFHLQVSALSFSENGSFFVTVGVRHVKFWYFDTESNKSKVRKPLILK